MLFASLCYHLEFFNYTLHCNFKHNFFQLHPNAYQSLAVVKYPWNAAKYTPVFTGLPPHVSSPSNGGSEAGLHNLKDKLIHEFKVELDKHVNNGDKYFDSKTLKDKLDLLEKNIID